MKLIATNVAFERKHEKLFCSNSGWGTGGLSFLTLLMFSWRQLMTLAVDLAVTEAGRSFNRQLDDNMTLLLLR